MPKRCSDSDEVNVAVSLGLLTAEEVLETIKDLPTEKIVLFTAVMRGIFCQARRSCHRDERIKHPLTRKNLPRLP